MSAAIDLLRERGVLSPRDAHFALTLGRLAGESDERVLLAAAMASPHVGHGHVCLDLARLVTEGVVDDEGAVVDVAWPPLAEWIAALRASVCVAVWTAGVPPAGAAEQRRSSSGAKAEESTGPDGPVAGGTPAIQTRPLILDDGGRLYLQRYFAHQQTLAHGILSRAHPIEPRREIPRELLAALFPAAAEAPQQPTLFDRVEPDWQRVAAIAALDRRFTAISGGPGTGKTYTVVKILALLLEQALRAGERPPRLLLLAPTGKAAARLKQSVASLAAKLPLRDEVRALLPAEASTIHRALGVRPGSRTRFRHDRDEPLLADVVLVDEASMVDLALMARLVDALPPHARLILLGDKDQLASVEAGAGRRRRRQHRPGRAPPREGGRGGRGGGERGRGQRRDRGAAAIRPP